MIKLWPYSCAKLCECVCQMKPSVKGNNWTPMFDRALPRFHVLKLSHSRHSQCLLKCDGVRGFRNNKHSVSTPHGHFMCTRLYSISAIYMGVCVCV